MTPPDPHSRGRKDKEKGKARQREVRRKGLRRLGLWEGRKERTGHDGKEEGGMGKEGRKEEGREATW
jgi:hypothetical protein